MQLTLRMIRESREYTTQEVAFLCGLTKEDVDYYEDNPGEIPFN